MATPDPRLLSALEQNGKLLKLKLIAYTAAIVWTKVWHRGHAGGHLAKGYSVEDVVQEAFEKALSGERVWNPKRHPDPLDFLQDVVKSLVSNMSRSRDNQTVCLANDDSMNARDDEPTDNLTEDEERVMKDIHKLAKKRPDVQKILDAVQNGLVDGKGDLSTATGLTRNDVSNALRHTKRHVLPPKPSMHPRSKASNE